MNEWQIQVREFVATHKLEMDLSHRLLDLASEVGELIKERLIGNVYGLSADAYQTENWEDEWGDVLFALLCVANITEVDAERALARVLEKYRSRLILQGDAGSSNQRQRSTAD